MNHLYEATLSFLSGGLTKAGVWQVIAYTLITTHITIAGVTIYLHRCQAHRALELHPAVSHFFRFWLWLSTGQVTKEWAAVHRKHHAKVESAEDPHSPVAHGIGKVLLQGTELYRAEARNPETLRKYGHGTPDDWLERNVYSALHWQGVGLLLVVDVLLFGAIGLAVWGVQMLWIPVSAAGVINGLGHFWGYRNYDCADASTNIVPLGLLIGGEELHNNHHAFGSSAKLSSKWYEFDIGWLYIRVLAAFGLATVKKLAPKPRFDRRKPVADFETLQAVIANRYDVMAKYAKSLRATWREEVASLKRRTEFDRGFLKNAKKLLQREPAKLEAPQRQQLSELLSYSKALQTMHEMRVELSAIWERSHASRDQLLQLLQDWCARAEASGVKPLCEFSRRLRSYA